MTILSRKNTGRALAFALLLLTVTFLWGCPDPVEPPVEEAVPVLSPEPEGAPTETADGRLSCAGNNAPEEMTGTTVQLLAYVRLYSDPDNDAETVPAAQVEAFDETGLSIGTSFSDTSNGRVSMSVSVRSGGFTGSVAVTLDGYIDWVFSSSRAFTPPRSDEPPSGWAWLLTPAELDDFATDLEITQTEGNGLLVGAVHDCDGFGVGAAVVVIDDETDGVIYFDDPAYQNSESGIGAGHFAADSEATFTQTGGRFAVPNLAPGNYTVAAYGRRSTSGSLQLLSTTEVSVAADTITAVDLQPRVGATR